MSTSKEYTKKKKRYNVLVPDYIHYKLSTYYLSRELDSFCLLYKDDERLWATPFSIYSYETHHPKMKLGFYLSTDISNVIEEMSIANLRNTSNQALHLIYSYYNYICQQ